MSAPQTSLVRPAEQICSEINAVTKKAVFHKNKSDDFWETRKALVRELKTEYPEAWLRELKEWCQIGRTQAFKLAAIADGRTNIEKEREKQREADRRHHESKNHRSMDSKDPVRTRLSITRLWSTTRSGSRRNHSQSRCRSMHRSRRRKSRARS